MIVLSFKKKWYEQKLSHQNNVREPYRKITHSRMILFRINGRFTDTTSNVQQKGSWDGDVPGRVADRERDTDIIVSRRKCDAMIGVGGIACAFCVDFYFYFSPFFHPSKVGINTVTIVCVSIGQRLWRRRTDGHGQTRRHRCNIHIIMYINKYIV